MFPPVLTTKGVGTEPHAQGHAMTLPEYECALSPRGSRGQYTGPVPPTSGVGRSSGSPTSPRGGSAHPSSTRRFVTNGWLNNVVREHR